MRSNGGLVVVSRIYYQSDPRFYPKRAPSALGISDAEIIDRYDGFDGDAWFPEPDEDLGLDDGLAPFLKS